MKTLVTAFALLMFTGAAQALPVHYYGEINGSGEYQGTVTSANAWANPPFGLNQTGQQINLWGLNASAGQTLSLAVNSLDGLVGGFSLYYGEITNNNLLFGQFDNDGSVGGATYLGGTSTFGWDSSLSDILLGEDGFYTLAVGGKSFGFGNEYDYTMDVAMTSVPEASSLLLMATGVMGIVALRRRQSKREQAALRA
ncbi:PEP-CTERM sorting domain-containing protein [Marinimicrobium agarilyticum]|uniref:PEP-CTERM sorting domain-containing protein n=1 Tax=Marinimicrobium agarilyticum TaxID=306546 RepID=UPI000419A6E4|nr:PEP-CTERM sorting domain-containing protein [Marinimicrobium agarilyticum]